MIEKQNILELFGSDSRSYHSVIITCYSFDFVFFEERVLPRLRQAGMVNINIFIDASMYERQLNDLDTSQYLSKNAYSITPIKLRGAFHPKIILGVGRNNGFLAVGSGNLTNSGLSSNDEIWGAFHTYKGEGKSAPLIKNAYQYLRLLEKQTFGINKSKLTWISDNSSWLRELVSKSDIPETIIHNNETIRLLSSLADKSNIDDLIKILPDHSPERITIIAPYYNKDGHILKLFQESLKPQKMDVVVDDRFGTVPYNYISNEHVYFHSWENIRKSSQTNSPRLHAKIFQFEYSNQSYLLIGSANCSKEALGTKNLHGKNAEMGVLMHSASKKDWLKELDIEIPEKGAYQIDKYEPDSKLEPFNAPISFENTIMHTELDHEELQLHLELVTNESESLELKVDNRDGSAAYYTLNGNNSFQTIALSSEHALNCVKVCLTDSKDLRISNYSLIHRIQLLENTNPDEKRKRFHEIISNEVPSASDLLELLEYAQFNRPDSFFGGKKLNPKSIHTREEETKIYQTVGEEEFNKNEAVPQFKSNGQTTNLSSLEDFLNSMTFGDIGGVKGEDVSESNERKALDEKETGFFDSEEAVKYTPQLSYTEGKRLKGKMHRRLEEINKLTITTHKYLVDILIDKKNLSIPIGIEDIQAILVGVHLIFMKMDKEFIEERLKIIIKYKIKSDLEKFESERGLGLKRIYKQSDVGFNEVAYTIDSEARERLSEVILDHSGISLVYIDDTPSIIVSHDFFSPGHYYVGKKLQTGSIKGFLVNTICPFLLILANGVETCENHEKKKFIAYKKRLFYRLLLLVAKIKWYNEDTEIYRLLLLNIFYQLWPGDPEDEIWREFELHKEKIAFKESTFSKNLESIKKLFKEYMEWHETYSNNKERLFREIGSTMSGNIMFKKQFGFSSLSTKYSNSVNLITPLGIFNKNNENYEFPNVLMGAKGIFF